MRLRNVVPDYEDALKAKVLERRTAVLEKQVGSLQQEIAALKRVCQSWKDKYKHAVPAGVPV